MDQCWSILMAAGTAGTDGPLIELMVSPLAGTRQPLRVGTKPSRLPRAGPEWARSCGDRTVWENAVVEVLRTSPARGRSGSDPGAVISPSDISAQQSSA